MPVYEYECRSCAAVTEAWQKISDAPLTACPHCSGELKKIVSCSSFHLKGSGWYVTDYAGRNSSSTTPKEDGSSKSCEKAAPKTETKE